MYHRRSAHSASSSGRPPRDDFYDDATDTTASTRPHKYLRDIWDELIPEQREYLKDEDPNTLIAYNPSTKMYQLSKTPKLLVTDENGLIKAGLDPQYRRPKSKLAEFRRELQHHGGSTMKIKKAVPPAEPDVSHIVEAARLNSEHNVKQMHTNRFSEKKMQQSMALLPPKGADQILRNLQAPSHEFTYPIGSLPGENGLIFTRPPPIKGEDLYDVLKVRRHADVSGAATGNEMIYANNRARREREPLRSDGLPMVMHFEPRKELPFARMNLMGEQTRFTHVMEGDDRSTDILKQVAEKRMRERVLPRHLGFDQLSAQQTFTTPMIGDGSDVEDRMQAELFRKSRAGLPDLVDNYFQTTGASVLPKATTMMGDGSAVEDRMRAEMFRKSRAGMPDLVGNYFQATGANILPTTTSLISASASNKMEGMIQTQQFLKSRDLKIPQELMVPSQFSLPTVKAVSEWEVMNRVNADKLQKRDNVQRLINEYGLNVPHPSAGTMQVKQVSAGQMMAIDAQNDANHKARLAHVLNTYGHGPSVGGQSMVMKNDTVDGIKIAMAAMQNDARDKNLFAAMASANGGNMSTMPMMSNMSEHDAEISMQRVGAQLKQLAREGLMRVPSVASGPESHAMVTGGKKKKNQHLYEKHYKRPFEAEVLMKRNEPAIPELEPQIVMNHDMRAYTDRNIDLKQYGSTFEEPSRAFFRQNDKDIRVKNPITGVLEIAPMSTRDSIMQGVQRR